MTYHDPCDLGRHAGIYDEPREIIRKIAPNFWNPGVPGKMRCAAAPEEGFAASSRRIPSQYRRNRLAQIIEETGAEILLTECPSCLHNFRNARRKLKIEIYNITEFIAQLLQERQKKEQPDKQ